MLRVTISGGRNSGKTSLAFALEQFLLQRGFTNVHVKDPDFCPERRLSVHNDTCLATVRSRYVLIETDVIEEGAL